MRLTHIVYRSILKLWEITPFKRMILLLVRFLRIPINKFNYDLWFNGIFTVKLYKNRIKLIASKGDNSALSLFWDKLDEGWDAKSIFVFAELAKTANVVIDIGSNIGLYALVAKSINPNCNVHAFEPSKKMFEILKKNIRVNNMNINAYQLAISNVDGELTFYDLKTPTAIFSLKLNENLKQDEYEEYLVPVITFQRFVKEHVLSSIDLISIDVEMNEPEVLEGMGKVLEKYHPTILIEVLNNSIGRKIEPYFSGLNYRYYRIDEIDGLKPSNNLQRLDDNEEKKRGFNFLICTIEVANQLGLDVF